MKPIPEVLTVLRFGCPKTKLGEMTIRTGTSARRHLNAVLQRACQQMIMPFPPAIRKVRRRMLETLADHRPIWDRNDQHGNPAEGATIVLGKEIKMMVAALIDRDGNIIPSKGTTPEQVEEIKRLLAEQTDEQENHVQKHGDT